MTTTTDRPTLTAALSALAELIGQARHVIHTDVSDDNGIRDALSDALIDMTHAVETANDQNRRAAMLLLLNPGDPDAKAEALKLLGLG